MPSLEAKPPCPAPSPVLLFLLLLAASVATSEDDADAFRTWHNCGAAASQPPPPPPLISPSPAPSQPPTPSTTTTTNSSMFRTNLLALLEAIPRAAAPTGFAALSLGDGPDRAFVRGLCYGGTAPAVCLANMQAAARNFTGSCVSSTRRAAIWYNRCYITYADTNVSTSYEEDYQAVLYDTGRLADPDSFRQTYYTLMGRLVARATSGDSTDMLATGHVEYAAGDPDGTMYGLVQCMRDRSAADCRRCLQNSMKQTIVCCKGYQGGVVMSYDCYLRIQIYTYYDLALDAPPPSAPPPTIPSPSPPAGERRAGKRRSKHVILAVILPIGLVLLVVVSVCFYLRRRIRANRRPRGNTREDDDDDNDSPSCTYVHPDKFTLPLLRAATGNFTAENKLGEGGFGQVFKGKLADGQTIAVKRLSKGSSQGFHELKNELVMAAKLRHRNLVQILGVCLEEHEKLVVYEYLPNRSLDTLLFDEGRRRLDWRRRYRIVGGIARGLLYLHEESRLRVIHRDLKPSNVLLDEKMNAKISDFALARAFRGDQSRDVTKRAAGTLGYMSPEYAYCGHVSTKSDMFSFGVMVLEIVTGRRNNGPGQDTNDTKNLLTDVWDKWRAGSAAAEMVDASLGDRYAREEVLSCVQIGLLCVQKKPELRPAASSVVVMLDSPSTSLQTPTRPAFYAGGAARRSGHDYSRRSLAAVSENGVTMSEVEPR